jgi:hypothetical protein
MIWDIALGYLLAQGIILVGALVIGAVVFGIAILWELFGKGSRKS